MTDNDTLSQNQHKAIVALLSESTVRDAAKAAGIGERTIWRYLSDDGFKTELRKRQDAVIASVTASLVGLAGESVETLHDLLQDAETPASVKARVALGWLAQMRQSVELADLAQRVEALEQERG